MVLSRATRNCEKVLPVSLREPPVALGKVGRNGQGSPVQLVDEKSVAARELLRAPADGVSKVHRLLIDL
jgi:hypothetical protein